LKAGGLVKLDPDVLDMLSDSKDVNDALRTIMRDAPEAPRRKRYGAKSPFIQ
jgi:hypothetical protein